MQQRSNSFTGRSNHLFIFFCLFILQLSFSTFAQDSPTKEQREVAEFIKEKILDGRFGERTLWMTPTMLDSTFIIRDMIKDKTPDMIFPYTSGWMVMIDDHPGANFGHPVRWVFVRADLKEHLDPIERDFPPVIISDFGKGKSVEFGCVNLTEVKCPEIGVLPDTSKFPKIEKVKSCLYAVLVSGGIRSSKNYSRYSQNLKSMYKILLSCGYKKSNIFVYYADGTSLDLDNKDGDNNDATGNDVTDMADESKIRAKLKQLCDHLNPRRDILFTYFSNHGSNNKGVCLWDVANDGLDANELYSPLELGADVADCKVCRHFMIHDQCYSGEFLPLATDGNHKNLVVYASANDSESSWGREYMAQWEKNDAITTTLNDMHQDVELNGNLTSTPGMAEGTPGIGDYKAGTCCVYTIWDWLKKYIYVIILIVIVVPILIFIRRKSART